MENIDKKLTNFLAKKNNVPTSGEEVVIPQRDGLLERREIINPKQVTKDGRQLLREVRYEA